MTSENERYWFPAKRYGWGWGIPRRWEGWAVLLGFLVLATAGSAFFHSPERTYFLFCYHAVLVTSLVLICWKKGAPPRWRWGDKT
jgi:hypothetical protein